MTDDISFPFSVIFAAGVQSNNLFEGRSRQTLTDRF